MFTDGEPLGLAWLCVSVGSTHDPNVVRLSQHLWCACSFIFGPEAEHRHCCSFLNAAEVSLWCRCSCALTGLPLGVTLGVLWVWSCFLLGNGSWALQGSEGTRGLNEEVSEAAEALFTLSSVPAPGNGGIRWVWALGVQSLLLLGASLSSVILVSAFRAALPPHRARATLPCAGGETKVPRENI